MSQENFQAFGVVNDNDESLKGKEGGGVFGLNPGFITTLEFNPNAGKDGSAGDAVDITLTIGDREFRRRIYDVTRIYDKDGNEMEENNDPTSEYQKKYRENISQATAVIIHAVKATGVTQAQLEKALATPLANFAEWATVVTSLVTPGFESKPVDAFLEYQWSIKGENDRTYLELPKNMKGGRFLAPGVNPVGAWKAETEWSTTEVDGSVKSHSGLRFIDQANNVHIFERSQSYMESNKAIQQIDGQDNQAPAAPIGGNAPVAQNAKKSSW